MLSPRWRCSKVCLLHCTASLCLLHRGQCYAEEFWSILYFSRLPRHLRVHVLPILGRCMRTARGSSTCRIREVCSSIHAKAATAESAVTTCCPG
ncbi:hypothetical protein PF005_g26347 [Phytophthora fragariae]|uniref:Secreted protein n=1 Tax=Phytophthora fragariae TaxID=53985 RepID=A0A6A3DKN7_9STRA|nr:hypothetical protein PF003_g6351 [Phytophthora fragariae]KAE8922644.1 hypothetical protein PF009_g27094 [Phytophthora fragariae]KAE8976851.1 hypothetical protein PF011_g23885 [Phytophthora fragariae]KAE9065395.1 hypothetical protein PF010_g28217 [Phytophthora fragariae]KAE9068243.1 hypothetical protein PF007_g27762 [Phytophthora fragariae]